MEWDLLACRVGIGLAIVSIGSILVLGWLQERRTWRELGALPVTPIARLEQGQVARVIGRVVLLPGGPVSPLGQKPCAAYRAEVILTEPSFWLRSDRVCEERARDFVIEDASGRAQVRMAGAVVRLTAKTKGSAWTPHLAAFLVDRSRSPRGKSISWSEGVLTPGQEICVYGAVAREKDPEPAAGFAGYREQPTLAVLYSRGSAQLAVTDHRKLTRSARSQPPLKPKERPANLAQRLVCWWRRTGSNRRHPKRL